MHERTRTHTVRSIIYKVLCAFKAVTVFNFGFFALASPCLVSSFCPFNAPFVVLHLVCVGAHTKNYPHLNSGGGGEVGVGMQKYIHWDMC